MKTIKAFLVALAIVFGGTAVAVTQTEPAEAQFAIWGCSAGLSNGNTRAWAQCTSTAPTVQRWRVRALRSDGSFWYGPWKYAPNYVSSVVTTAWPHTFLNVRYEYTLK